MNYLATNNGTEAYLKAENPYIILKTSNNMELSEELKYLTNTEWKVEIDQFERDNPPIFCDPSAVKDGDRLTEEEFKERYITLYQYQDGSDWYDCVFTSDARNVKEWQEQGYVVRLFAIPKEQPKQEEVSQIRTGVINRNAVDNNTWLAPYRGYKCKLIITPDSEEILIEGESQPINAIGGFVASNGWEYTMLDLIDFDDQQSDKSSLTDESGLRQQEQPKGKPLSDITDEDAIEVLRFGGIQDDKFKEFFDMLKEQKEFMDYFFHVRPLYFAEAISIYQYLASKGYDLPVYYPSPSEGISKETAREMQRFVSLAENYLVDKSDDAGVMKAQLSRAIILIKKVEEELKAK